jgi:DNA-directed RNA polymerase subunit beta'
MVLDIVPVTPPDLRPLVPLDGGRFATSDLNDLYRRAIIRNNRLKRLIDIKAPEVILRNEKRMLQESVDALFDNSRRAVRSESQRPLKSLADTLKGKTGRFRQNLLGKRVDYSGRSVIVVGPELKLHECGLPKDLALELFKPFIIRRLIERGHVKTVKSAKKLIERKATEVYDILEMVIQGHPVLLNRAPTLHRLGIQAFQPRLIEGKAIQLHPLVCTAFNADFDGDQMAVHLPISFEAQLEAFLLMLAPHNIMHTQNGAPIAVPSQDMVLGAYYLTKIRPGATGESRTFASKDELMVAYNLGQVDLHAKIKVRYKNTIQETSPGRMLFNEIVPEELGFLNELLTKKRLRNIIGVCFRSVGLDKTATFLDSLKDMGFKYATIGGLSVNISDVVSPPDKEEIIKSAQKKIDTIESAYHNGVISVGERYNKIIDA